MPDRARPAHQPLMTALARMCGATDARGRRDAIEEGTGRALALAERSAAEGSADHAEAYRAIAARIAATPPTGAVDALTDRVRLAVRLLDAPDGPARAVRSVGGLRLIAPRPPA